MSHVRYEVLDDAGSQAVDLLHPTSPGSVVDDMGARTLSGLVLPPTDTPPQVGSLIRPVWVTANGTEHSLGVFPYQNGSRTKRAGGWWTTCYPMADRLGRLQRKMRNPLTVEASAVLTTRAASILEAAGFAAADFDIWPNGQTLGPVPMAYAPGDVWVSPLDAIAKLLGYLPVYDNGAETEWLVFRPIPRPAYEVAARTILSVGTDGTVLPDTLTETPPAGFTPNIFVGTSTSPGDAPVTGEWWVPAGQPNSVENVGEIPEFLSLPGLVDDAQADLVVEQAAAVRLDASTVITCDTEPDPTAGTFDVVNLDGENVLEIRWELPLSGGRMSHTFTRVYADG